MVTAVCRGLLQCDSEVQDAVQDSFVRAYMNLEQLRDTARFAAWLRSLARSICMTQLKRRRSGTKPIAQIDHLSGNCLEPSNIAETQELGERVLECIARLPERYRTPLEMFYYEGASQEEIARKLKLKAGCVRIRLHRGRKLLKPELWAYSPIEVLSRSKEIRQWLPPTLALKESTEMALEYKKTKRRLLRGDTELTIRPMLREDIPALRRFDTELTPTLDDVNSQYPPGGHKTCPGGPWSDDEWLLEHFNKYAEHGALTLLAEDDKGKVVGFADLWTTDEPKPFGLSLNVECIDYFRNYYLAGLEIVLLTEAEKIAREAGLSALDIGTNTCSGEYVSLRRFGLMVFYEYDHVLCKCQEEQVARKPTKRMLTPSSANLSGMIRVSHWSPTDFTFRSRDERGYIAELTWPEYRVILELWVFNNEGMPVPENPPSASELYVEPRSLASASAMSEILAACANLAGEVGAEQLAFPCPSDIELDASKVDVIDRQFRYAWLRKKL